MNNEDPDTEYPNNEEHTSCAYDDRTEKEQNLTKEFNIRKG